MKMKLKGCSAFFTPEKLALCAGVSTLICAILRVFHVFKLIEPETGFYSEKNFSVVLFFIVFAAGCLFCLIGSFLSEKALDTSAENINGNPFVGIVSIFLAAGFFLDFSSCFTVLNISGNEMYYGDNQFADMMRTGSLPRKAEMVLALLAFLYCAVFAIMILTKKYKGQMKIFSLVTVFWGVSRLVSLFVKQISFVQVSDLFLEIAATAFTTIFFFSLCECLSGVYRKDALWRVLGAGLPAAITNLTIQIPRIIAAIADNAHIDEADYTPLIYSNDFTINYVQIFTAVLVIALFVTLMKKTVSQKQEKEKK